MDENGLTRTKECIKSGRAHNQTGAVYMERHNKMCQTVNNINNHDSVNEQLRHYCESEGNSIYAKVLDNGLVQMDGHFTQDQLAIINFIILSK